MSSIVQQRKLALLNGDREAKRSLSPADPVGASKESRGRGDVRGSSSPLMARYRPETKTESNTAKDARSAKATFGSSPNREFGNKTSFPGHQSKNFRSNDNESKFQRVEAKSEARGFNKGHVDSKPTDNSSKSKLEKNAKNSSAGKDKEVQHKPKAEVQTTPKSHAHDKDRTESKPEAKPAEKKSEKQTRFAMRKQRRAKRHRSDGYMLALEMGANSSEDEGAPFDSTLGDAINFLQWIRNPTLQNLAKLRRAIKTNDKDWMIEFLEFDGLGLLFQCLKDLTTMQGFHLSDMVLKMECTMCIREVVNSQTGLDCLLKIKGKKDNIFGRRFAAGKYLNGQNKCNLAPDLHASTRLFRKHKESLYSRNQLFQLFLFRKHKKPL